MKSILSVIAVSVILVSAGMSYAAENIKADDVVDLTESTVSYKIETAGGEDLVITADYAQTRPNPEIENMDISPLDNVYEGARTFKIITKEGIPIDIQFVYARGERVGMAISAEPSNPASDLEYSQILSAESSGGYIIIFTFVWQGKDLKEVRVEPQLNPFAASR